MSDMFRARRSLCIGGFFFLFSTLAWGQAYLLPQGEEHALIGARPGDQVSPSLSLSSSGGAIAWEDNWIDRNGSGIGTTRLTANAELTGTISAANKVAAFDQLKPQVQILKNGEALYVWESRAAGTPDIYARLARNGKFYTNDFRLNSRLRDQQGSPVVTALPDGGAVVAWASYGQDGSLWGVYARKVMANAARPKPEFQVTQSTEGNQRDPAIAVLANGGFVVAWVSEIDFSRTVRARVFDPACQPIGDEFLVNSGTNACAMPAVAGLASGGFTVVWGERSGLVRSNGWEILGRSFSASAVPAGPDFQVNAYSYGDQFRPKIAASPAGCLVVWTSLAQDGSREGVYGRFLLGGSQVAGDEFRVNTTTVSQQIEPTVAWNGADRFVVVWASFVAQTGFDLFKQAYVLNLTR